MSCAFKGHVVLVGEDVDLLLQPGNSIQCEILAEAGAGYYVRVPNEGGQEYFIPANQVVLIKAMSRKIRDSGDA
jgi:hypothetical protein